MVYNCNHIFSFFIPLDVYVYCSFALLLIFFFGYLRIFKPKGLEFVGLLLVLLGGISNLYERKLFGCVKDYINFFDLFHFNLYDLMVVCGVSVLILKIWKKRV